MSLIIYKNAFQSKAHLPLANRQSNTYNLTLEWPLPRYDLDLIYDLDLRQVKLSLTDVQVAKLPFSMRWSWPWPNDLDTQTWPRYGQDVTPYQKWSFYVNLFKSYSRTDRQTHRQTRRHDENITSTAYAGGKYESPSPFVSLSKWVMHGIKICSSQINIDK